MIINAVIVDDKEQDLIKIANMIQAVSLDIKTDVHIQTFMDPADRRILQKYDLYILDIEMPGISGFKLAKSIIELYPDATIIFCSDHEDLVFDTFKLNAFYFVRKSLIDDDLLLALRKFIKSFSEKNSSYCFISGSTVNAIRFSDIQYFEVLQSDLYIHTADKEYHERKSMKKLTEQYPMISFIQISSGYLVNASFISLISENKVILKNGMVLTIPRRNVSTVKNQYARYLMRY